MSKKQKHHLQFPRKDYQTPIQRIYRQLGCRIVLLTHEEHLAIHQTLRETPGGVPSDEFMRAQIDYCRSQGCSGTICRIRGGGDG